jgi:hypothetical protein
LQPLPLRAAYGPLGDEIPYAWEDRRILTDQEPSLKLLYVADVSDTSRMSPGFAEALSADIARSICMGLGKSSTTFERLTREAEVAVTMALQAEAMFSGNHSQVPPVTRWIDR